MQEDPLAAVAPGLLGWFRDHLVECGDTEMESLVLLDGDAGWVTGGAEHVGQMGGYTKEY